MPSQTRWGVWYLRIYRPHTGPINPDKFSNEIILLKGKNQVAIHNLAVLWCDEMNITFPKCVFVSVPSSRKGNCENGVALLCTEIAKRLNQIDGSSCLEKYIEVLFSKWGDRSQQKHLDSIRIINKEIIKGNNIWLLDDITTSGNTLMACKKLLKEAGAFEVKCSALCLSQKYIQ
jgi:predicted amidophosphoribosyltransferase